VQTLENRETVVVPDDADLQEPKTGFGRWYKRMKEHAWFLTVVMIVGLGIVVLGAQLAVEGATTIAERLGVSKPMTAAHLQSLEEKGYIYREASPGDKRSFFVRPTEAGRELAREFETKQREYMKKVEEKMGEGEFDELVRLLESAHRILHGMRDES
jgi:DNA-binding MarR family transcriptional regulator